MSIEKFENDKLSRVALGNLVGGVKNTKQGDGGKDQFKVCSTPDGDVDDYRYKKEGKWGEWHIG
jgi:hypothetical protein